MSTSLDKTLRDLTTTTIRVQPVEPAPRTTEEIGKLIGVGIFIVPGILALTSWFLMLAAGTLHDLFPAVPTVGFWQAVTLVLGLQVVANMVKPRSFKWARR